MRRDGASLVRDDQRAAAEATLILAFAEDPVQRWLYPETERDLEGFPIFLSQTSAAAYDAGGVWHLGDSSAVAVWMPPDAHEVAEVLVSSLTQTVESYKHADLMAMLDRMSVLQPAAPHWHAQGGTRRVAALTCDPIDHRGCRVATSPRRDSGR